MQFYRMKKSLFILIALCLWPMLPRQAATQSAALGLYEQANQAYQEGKFPEAIGLYEQILQSGVANGLVFYNLGNAYFKDNQLGRAILSWERASRLLPRDTDVVANLTLARELTVDKIEVEKRGLLFLTLTSLARSGSISELTLMAFLLYLATSALVVAVIWIRKIAWRKKMLVVTLSVGVLLTFTLASLLGKIYQQKVTAAIVLAPVVEARSGPGVEYTKIFTAHEGTKVRIRQQREGWNLISLPNGLGGWIPEDAAEII
jgi:tetratricopeptide (TPR) repeat protein